MDVINQGMTTSATQTPPLLSFTGILMLLEATQKGKKSKKYIRSGLGIEPITYHMYTNQLSWSSVSMFKQTFSRSFQKSVNTGQTCDKQKGRKENM